MTRRNLVIGGLILLVGAAFLIRSKNKILPNGKLIEGDTVDSNLLVTPEPISGKPRVDINTSKGRITLELRPDLAPKTVDNFLSKWANDFCVGKTFHRVEDWVVQGCDPAGDGTGGNTSLPTETSTEKFLAGSVGVARKSTPRDLSNDSQFFIVKKDSTFLDGDYTYFGKVVAGMSVVNSLTIGDKIISTAVLTK